MVFYMQSALPMYFPSYFASMGVLFFLVFLQDQLFLLQPAQKNRHHQLKASFSSSMSVLLTVLQS